MSCPIPQARGWDWIPVANTNNTLLCDSCTATALDQNIVADWGVSDGALASANQLHSAVIMQLFTDKRIPADQSDYVNDSYECGGWWGDYFAPFEIGSHLWTLRRAALTDQTIKDAERFTREALQPLVDQGAAATLKIIVEANKLKKQLFITPMFYARDGAVIYKQQFARYWDD